MEHDFLPKVGQVIRVPLNVAGKHPVPHRIPKSKVDRLLMSLSNVWVKMDAKTLVFSNVDRAIVS